MRPLFVQLSTFFSTLRVTGYSTEVGKIFLLSTTAMITIANAEPLSHTYPPIKLRAYGTVSGTFTPGTIDAQPVSTLSIVCEDESKAKLVQAKYLSDLQSLPGVKPITVPNGQATLPGLKAEDQGVFLAARNGS